jgi:hypothetical protein
MGRSLPTLGHSRWIMEIIRSEPQNEQRPLPEKEGFFVLKKQKPCFVASLKQKT